MPEPYVLKGTRTVLRGERGSNIPDLPDQLEQAVGRARLLRKDCTVNLFSNFPLCQANMREFEYDDHADDDGTVEDERKEL